MQNRIATIILAAWSMGGLALNVTPAAAQTRAEAETYQLVQVAGGSLPVVVEEEEDGCREEVLAGTLTLASDGRWTLVTSEREVCGEDIEEDEEREGGTYEVNADNIRFLDDDDDDDDDNDADADLDLDDLVTGIRTGAELTVRLDDEQTVLVFRR